MEAKIIILIVLCVVIVGGLVFLHFKNRKKKRG